MRLASASKASSRGEELMATAMVSNGKAGRPFSRVDKSGDCMGIFLTESKLLISVYNSDGECKHLQIVV